MKIYKTLSIFITKLTKKHVLKKKFTLPQKCINITQLLMPLIRQLYVIKASKRQFLSHINNTFRATKISSFGIWSFIDPQYIISLFLIRSPSSRKGSSSIINSMNKILVCQVKPLQASISNRISPMLRFERENHISRVIPSIRDRKHKQIQPETI